MELRISDYKTPAKIDFNFEELKNELNAKADQYATVVYTEDQIKLAKADRASLNKLKKSLNDERIRREKEYLEPFNEFKLKINQIIAIIDKPIYMIDKQIKEYEDLQKQDKRKEIEDFFAGIVDKPEWLSLDQFFDPKWLNASVSMKSVTEEIGTKLDLIKKEVETIGAMPEFSFEALETYKTTLNITASLSEGKRLADIQKRKEESEKIRKEAEERAKAEAEAKKLEEVQAKPVPEDFMNPPVEEVQAPAQWINFSAYLTIAQARELKKFFDDRCIDFKAI